MYLWHSMKLNGLFGILFLLAGSLHSLAQTDAKVVQVSGVVISNDSTKQFVPNVMVSVQGREGSSLSGMDGFFSIAAQPNDTILFRHFSFITQKMWVPDTVKGDAYLSLVAMNWTTIELQTVTLYPWPRPENLHRELLAMSIPTTEMDIAQRNLAIQALKEKAADMGYDAAEIGDYIIKTQNQNLYDQGRYYGANGGAALLGRLSNPLAWNEFFNAIKRGDFK